MAWVDVELDDGTFRSLRDRARREGLSVPELLSRIARREARRREAAPRRAPDEPLGWRSRATGRALNAAPGPEG